MRLPRFKSTDLILIGTATIAAFVANFAKILSQTALLSQYSARHYAADYGLAGMVFIAFLSSPFAKRSALILATRWLVLLGIVGLGFMIQIPDSFLQVNLWVVWSLLLNEVFFWLLTEVNQQIQHPTRATQLLPWIAAGFEVGTLFAVFGLALGLQDQGQSLQVLLLIAGIAILILIASSALKFSALPDLRVLRARINTKLQKKQRSLFREILYLIGLVGLAVGFTRGLTEYLLSEAIQIEGVEPENVSRLLSIFYGVSSGLVIAVNPVLWWLGKHRRTSPLKLQIVLSVIVFAAALYSLLNPSLTSVLALALWVRVAFKTAFNQGMEKVYSSVSLMLRNRMKTISKTAALLLGGGLLALAPLWIHWFQNTIRIQIGAATILILSILLVGSFCLLKPRWTRFLWQKVLRGFKGERILAAEGITYLGVPNLFRHFNRLLLDDTRTLLRRTLIEGLAFTPPSLDSERLEVLKREFQSPKEEIQVAVIRTLSRYKSPREIEFISQVVIDPYHRVPFRVRALCRSTLKRALGDLALPLLLKGLEAENTAVLADTIELLVRFKNPYLIQEYERFLDHPNARVKAAALLGLHNSRERRRDAERGLIAMVRSDDPDAVVAALRVIGRLPKTAFEKTLREFELLEQHLPLNLQISLALGVALVKFDIQKKGENFVRAFERSIQGGRLETGLTYFLRFRDDERLMILRTLVEIVPYESLTDLPKVLAKSGYELTLESAYLEGLLRSRHPRRNG